MVSPYTLNNVLNARADKLTTGPPGLPSGKGTIEHVSAEQQYGDEDATGWIFMIECTLSTPRDINITYVGEEGDDFEQILLDSGAFVHVCPAKYAEECPLQPATTDLALRSVTGKKLNIYGMREVRYDIWDEHGNAMELRIKFYVADVRRAIVATSRLLDRGFDVIEKASGCYLEKNGVKVPFARRNSTFVLLAKRQVQSLVAGLAGYDAMTAATRTLTGGGRSPGSPDEILMDEGRIAETLPVPERPSEEAIAKHMLTHMPYAAWCQDCVV